MIRLGWCRRLGSHDVLRGGRRGSGRLNNGLNGLPGLPSSGQGVSESGSGHGGGGGEGGTEFGRTLIHFIDFLQVDGAEILHFSDYPGKSWGHFYKSTNITPLSWLIRWRSWLGSLENTTLEVRVPLPSSYIAHSCMTTTANLVWLSYRVISSHSNLWPAAQTRRDWHIIQRTLLLIISRILLIILIRENWCEVSICLDVFMSRPLVVWRPWCPVRSCWRTFCRSA